MKNVCFLIVLFFLNSISVLSQSEIYVDASHIGSSNGTINYPWKNFQQFDINSIQYQSPIIYVAPGTYSGTSYLYGTKKALLLIENKPNVSIIRWNKRPGQIIFDAGEGEDVDWGIIALTNFGSSDNIRIEDIFFKNYKENGIFIIGSTQRINTVNILRCRVEQIKGAIPETISSAAVKIQNVEDILIHECTIFLNNSTNSGSQFDGIYVDESRDIVIKNNDIVLTNNYNGDVMPHIDCIQITKSQNGSGCTNVLIDNNFIQYEGTYGQDLGKQQGVYILHTGGEIIIQNNIIAAIHGKLIHTYLHSGTTAVKIYNNTLIQKLATFHTLEINKFSGTIDILAIKNNIFYKNSSDLVALKFTNISDTEIGGNNILDNNLYYNTNTGTILLSFQGGTKPWNYLNWWEVNGANGNPLFINYSTDDFRLNYKSPAKNIGIFIPNLTIDFFGNLRPYWNDDYDAGAYEIEDTQLKIGVYEYEFSVAHTLTSYGTYWEKNPSGNFEISSDQSLASASITTSGSIDPVNLYEFEGLEYKWLDRSHNSSGELIGTGFYKLTNDLDLEQYIYIDLRDAVIDYRLNTYVYYDNEFQIYKYIDANEVSQPISTGSIHRIWSANGGANKISTVSLQNYWEHALLWVNKNDNPWLVWGPLQPGIQPIFAVNEYYINKSVNYSWQPPADPVWFDEVASDKYDYLDLTVDIGNGFFVANYNITAELRYESDIINESDPTNMVSAPIQSQNKLDQKNLKPVYRLSQNYPNPFNPATTFKFSLPETEYVTLKIYDVLGSEVTTVIQDILNAGEHRYKFDGSGLSSGIYFYKLTAGSYISIMKMQLLK